MIKKGDSEQERMFGRVAEIPIANTFSGLAEMDIVDYEHYAEILRIQDTFSRFSVVAYTGRKEKGWANSGNGLRIDDFPRVSGVWAPGIIEADKDMVFIGGFSGVSYRSRHCFTNRNSRASSESGGRRTSAQTFPNGHRS